MYIATSIYVLCSTEKFVESDEYEDLPTENSLVHIAAGCTAGIAEHCVMYPVDLVKVPQLVASLSIEFNC